MVRLCKSDPPREGAIRDGGTHDGDEGPKGQAEADGVGQWGATPAFSEIAQCRWITDSHAVRCFAAEGVWQSQGSWVSRIRARDEIPKDGRVSRKPKDRWCVVFRCPKGSEATGPAHHGRLRDLAHTEHLSEKQKEKAKPGPVTVVSGQSLRPSGNAGSGGPRAQRNC